MEPNNEIEYKGKPSTAMEGMPVAAKPGDPLATSILSPWLMPVNEAELLAEMYTLILSWPVNEPNEENQQPPAGQ
jgi:hypothetical protein